MALTAEQKANRTKALTLCNEVVSAEAQQADWRTKALVANVLATIYLADVTEQNK